MSVCHSIAIGALEFLYRTNGSRNCQPRRPGLYYVIKWTIFLVEGQSLQEGFEAFQQVWGKRPNPPVITSFFVAALANPDYLLGIEAVAVL